MGHTRFSVMTWNPLSLIFSVLVASLIAVYHYQGSTYKDWMYLLLVNSPRIGHDELLILRAQLQCQSLVPYWVVITRVVDFSHGCHLRISPLDLILYRISQVIVSIAAHIYTPTKLFQNKSLVRLYPLLNAHKHSRYAIKIIPRLEILYQFYKTAVDSNFDYIWYIIRPLSHLGKFSTPQLA